jgi:parallel beta-helix repeat protein
LAVGIIFLFVGTSIIPAIAKDTKKPLLASRGDWLYVGGSGPGNYSRIQDAINDSVDGDTVFVYSGIYYEQLSIDKSISLIGEDKESTILYGYGTGEETVAIFLYPVENASISNFTIENFSSGIIAYSMYHHSAHNCSIYNIIFETGSGNGIDILLEDTTHMQIHDNTMNHGLEIYEAFDNIIADNTIHGKPLVYLEDKSNQIISNAGQVVLNKCENITVMDLEFNNTYSGIELYQSDYTYVYNNVFTGNYYGIEIRSEYNVIEDNTFQSNEYGILLQSEKWNTIFHNNFITNFDHVTGFFSGFNRWYDPKWGGNYWDDYTGTDSDGDGIGDTPYKVNCNEQDLYPFMNPEGWGQPHIDPPYGPTQGYVGIEYTFYFIIPFELPPCDFIIKWIWGDGTASDWLGPYGPPTVVNASHNWSSIGSYWIRVMLRDVWGAGFRSDALLIQIFPGTTLGIHNITGFFWNIRTIISNEGLNNAINVTWKIYTQKGVSPILFGHGTIPILSIGSYEEVRTDRPFFGLGRFQILVKVQGENAPPIENHANAFVFFFVIFLLK